MPAPKIGFEIEGVRFNLVGAVEDDPLLLAQEDNTKGQLLHFFAANGEPDPALNSRAKSNWIPTAEVQSNLRIIQLEMIYGGPTGMAISVEELGIVGGEMCTFLRALDAQPKGGAGKAFMRPANLLTLSQTNNHVRWEIAAAATTSGLGFHATAPISLAALPGLVNFEENTMEILFGITSKRISMKLVTPEKVTASGFNLASVQWRAGVRGKVYGENSVAGLLVMIMSYVTKAASSPSDTDMNLKTLIPLMPRTDFKTMLNIVTELMVENSATDFRHNLVDIVQNLREKGSSENNFFNWQRPIPNAPKVTEGQGPSQATSTAPPPPSPPRPPPPLAPGARGQRILTSNVQHPAQPWNLSVQSWLQDLADGKADQIAIKDAEFREKQIGALGNKVETLIGNESLLCPILEFRAIGNCSMVQLDAKPENFLQQLAARVVYWHKQVVSGV